MNINTSLAQQIVVTVKDACGYDINFITDQGIILASTDPKRIGTYHEIGAQAAKQQTTIEVQKDNVYDGTQKGVNIPCIYHQNLIGVIGISGEPDEVRRYGHLADRIMRLMLKERELEFSHESKRAEAGYVIRSLLNETIRTDYLQEYFKKKKLNFKDQYRIVLIQPKYSKHDTVGQMENMLETAFSSLKGVVYTLDYPDIYILLISEEQYKRQKNILKDLVSLPASISVGSSQHLLSVKKSYDDALIVKKSSKEQFAEIDQLCLEMLFADMHIESRKRYLEKTIASLDSKDIHLLSTYFQNNMSLKYTSEKLFIHKNTLQYRLEKVKEKTGLDPREFTDATMLYMGLVLLEVMDNATSI